MAREKDRGRLERLLLKAETVCLISRSVSSEITLNPTITIAPDGAAKAAEAA